MAVSDAYSHVLERGFPLLARISHRVAAITAVRGKPDTTPQPSDRTTPLLRAGDTMTEPLDPRSPSVRLRRSHRLEGKLGGLRYVFGLEILELNPCITSTTMQETVVAPALAAESSDGATPQAIGAWESEGGATP